MLGEILKEIDCMDDEKFTGDGIILFSPNTKRFYRIGFGSGSCDDLEEGCDDYMYLQIDEYDEDGYYQTDIDGGQMDINTEDYSGFINDEKLIRDCLEFLDCDDIDDLIYIQRFK